MSSSMHGVKRGQHAAAPSSAKKSKQGPSLVSISKLYRPFPDATSNDLAHAESGCLESTDAEESDPVAVPVLRKVADYAVLASSRTDVSRNTLNSWFEKVMRLEIVRARAAKVRGTKEIRDDWALHFRQIADIGSPRTKLYLVNSLLATAEKDQVGSRSDTALRAAAHFATACVDALVGMANSGVREPLELILDHFYALAAHRGLQHRSETNDSSLLDFLSARERASLEEALRKAKGKKSMKKAGELICMIREFELGRRKTIVNGNGDNVLTLGSGKASYSVSDGFRPEIGMVGVEKRNPKVQAPSRIPRKSDASSQLSRAHRRETHVPQELRSHPLLPALYQPTISKVANGGPSSSEIHLGPAPSHPASTTKFETDPARPVSQEHNLVLPLHTSKQQHSQSFANGAAYPPPPTVSAGSEVGSFRNRNLSGQIEAEDSRKDSRADGQVYSYSGKERNHAAGSKAGYQLDDPRNQLYVKQHLTGEAEAPHSSQQRVPNNGQLKARTRNGMYVPCESEGILKPMRGPATYDSPAVAFKKPDTFPPRTYLHEASTVFEIQPQRDVMHLFYDDGDPLDWRKTANKKHLEEIKERANIGCVHSVMALHALVRSKVEDMQRIQRGEDKPLRESIKVTYPTRNAPSQQRQERP